MNCRIFVEGAGRKTCGKLVNDWEGPIRDAIKNVSSFYRAVFNHVKACNKCDPTEVLQAYWDLRQQRNKGEMSGGIATLAARYLRIGADPALVKGFMNNPAYVDVALRCNQLFNDEELYGLMKEAYFDSEGLTGSSLLHRRTLDMIDKAMNKGSRLIVSNIILFGQNKVPLPPFKDVEKLAVVVEVTAS